MWVGSATLGEKNSVRLSRRKSSFSGAWKRIVLAEGATLKATSTLSSIDGGMGMSQIAHTRSLLNARKAWSVVMNDPQAGQRTPQLNSTTPACAACRNRSTASRSPMPVSAA